MCLHVLDAQYLTNFLEAVSKYKYVNRKKKIE